MARNYSKPFAISDDDWSYAAAASGITDSTAGVTLAPAVAGMINYLTAMQITSEPLGAATEVVVRDGADGAVLWRAKIGTAGWTQGFRIYFPSPLRSSPGVLLEFARLTGSGTPIYVNAQGYTHS